ncbi:hypothetical protein QZH41_013817, partial [Actinostola sp. cb2023]
SGPVIECLQCHEEVLMHEFRHHEEEKHGKCRKVAQAVDVATVNQDETVDILSECGLTVSLTILNELVLM